MNASSAVRWTARQLLSLSVAMLAASFAIYASVYLAPGSPESVIFGNKVPSPEARVAVRDLYGFDDPFLSSYWGWFTNALQGDFGMSIAFGQPVSDRIAAVADTTLFLVAYAALVSIVGGVALGAIAALRPGRVDVGVMLFTTLGIATPTFVTATLLIAVFGAALGWFPTFGPGEGSLDRLQHMTLPAITLALYAWAFIARVTRTAMREEMGREHVETAWARGLTRGVIIRHHVLRNALIPISTVAGLQVAGLIAGTIIVEQAFGLNGLGQLLVLSVNQKDLPTVQAVCLIMVAAFVIANTIVDLSYQVLDPRIRLKGTSA